jgi:hypothetical protein
MNYNGPIPPPYEVLKEIAPNLASSVQHSTYQDSQGQQQMYGHHPQSNNRAHLGYGQGPNVNVDNSYMPRSPHPGQANAQRSAPQPAEARQPEPYQGSSYSYKV